MNKKEYETPKMEIMDFEYKTSLLSGSCCHDGTKSQGFLSFNIDDITDPKA